MGSCLSLGVQYATGQGVPTDVARAEASSQRGCDGGEARGCTALGIFYENVVNKFLRDVVRATKPVSAEVIGEFTPRGGLHSKVTATWSKKRGGAR